MNPNDFLRIQLRLLITQFGRRNVLDALATSSEVSVQDLETELEDLARRSKAKRVKREKSLEEIVAVLPDLNDDRRKMVERLGRLFESKQFLPDLRDVHEFLLRSGAAPRKHKSRKEALASVLRACAAMPLNELSALVAETSGGAGQSDFNLLANQLMGKAR